MKFLKFFDNSIKAIFIGLLLWIVILILFFSNNIDYACKKVFLISNITILLLVILVNVIKIIINKTTHFKAPQINFDRLVKFLLPMFLLTQIYIFFHICFETDWDPLLIISDSRIIASGGKSQYLTYLSHYPNNLLIITFFSTVLKLNSLIGIFSSDYDVMSIVVINCFISTYTSYLIYKIGKTITTKKNAFIGYLAAVFLLVFSPWNVIYYSDSLGLLFPILILYIYLNKSIKYYYKYPLITLLAYMGFSIKPQTIIIVIAIVIVELMKIISAVNINKLKKIIFASFLSIIILIPTVFAMNKIYRFEGFNLDKESRLGLTHFLMMGSNNVNNGIYYRYDENMSVAQKNSKTRKEFNIVVFKNRVKEYGAKGYFDLLSKKMLTNYNDGTFAWGWEGEFYYKVKPKISKVSNLLRNIYYNDGILFPYYSSAMQIIWISIIIMIFKDSLIKIIDKKKDYLYLVLILTIIGLTIFELVFEARARYLYTNIPIYILLFVYSIKNIKKMEV